VFREVLIQFKEDLGTFLEDLRQEEVKEEEAFPDKEKEDVKSFTFKIIVCGDPSVGKTSTILRFTDNAFTRSYLPTIGVNISEKIVNIENNLVKLVLWDLAGQQKFEQMRSHFYQGVEGVLFVFDLTNNKTFNSIQNWHDDINSSIGRKVEAAYLLGNKCDLAEEREIAKEQGDSLANELSLSYYETSALTGEKIHETFKELAESLLNQKGIL
jgi:small GTP-binding protein